MIAPFDGWPPRPYTAADQDAFSKLLPKGVTAEQVGIAWQQIHALASAVAYGRIWATGKTLKDRREDVSRILEQIDGLSAALTGLRRTCAGQSWYANLVTSLSAARQQIEGQLTALEMMQAARRHMKDPQREAVYPEGWLDTAQIFAFPNRARAMARWH